jgi:serine/threonine-protein kinase RsbT
MKSVEGAVATILSGSISEITQRSIFHRLGPLAVRPVGDLSEADRRAVLGELQSSIRLFSRGNSTELIAACTRALAAAAGADPGGNGDARPAGSRVLPIEAEKDIAAARLEAWSEAVRIGLSKFTSVKVATAVSELARNIVFYAGRGQVELRTVAEPQRTRLQIVASDQGPGIEPLRLAEIYAGTYRSQRGMGKGLMAVKKLVDEFDLDTRPGRGTVVTCMFRGEG